MAGNEGGDEKIVLATFGRKNRQTGNDEQIRVMASHFNGRRYLMMQLWYHAKGQTDFPDGFVPTKQTISFRENEVEALMDALTLFREQGQGDGRPARDERPARTPRQQTRPVAQQQGRQTQQPRSNQPPVGRRPHQDEEPRPGSFLAENPEFRRGYRG